MPGVCLCMEGGKWGVGVGRYEMMWNSYTQAGEGTEASVQRP